MVLELGGPRTEGQYLVRAFVLSHNNGGKATESTQERKGHCHNLATLKLTELIFHEGGPLMT
jgi:hypothetical protein